MQMQLVGDRALPARIHAAIFEIADNRRAQGGEMHADLVRAAGDRLGRDPGKFLARPDPSRHSR